MTADFSVLENISIKFDSSEPNAPAGATAGAGTDRAIAGAADAKTPIAALAPSARLDTVTASTSLVSPSRESPLGLGPVVDAFSALAARARVADLARGVADLARGAEDTARVVVVVVLVVVVVIDRGGALSSSAVHRARRCAP